MNLGPAISVNDQFKIVTRAIRKSKAKFTEKLIKEYSEQVLACLKAPSFDSTLITFNELEDAMALGNVDIFNQLRNFEQIESEFQKEPLKYFLTAAKKQHIDIFNIFLSQNDKGYLYPSVLLKAGEYQNFVLTETIANGHYKIVQRLLNKIGDKYELPSIVDQFNSQSNALNSRIVIWSYRFPRIGARILALDKTGVPEFPKLVATFKSLSFSDTKYLIAQGILNFEHVQHVIQNKLMSKLCVDLVQLVKDYLDNDFELSPLPQKLPPQKIQNQVISDFSRRFEKKALCTKIKPTESLFSCDEYPNHKAKGIKRKRAP